jgi:amidohydrolase
VAVLKGNRAGKVLALRCDMDALNLQEENQISYKSQNQGIMHACAHDGHTAMLIGAVKILVKFKSILQGEIRFIFQHAEEWHPGGARELVGQGVLNGVDIILALHLWVALEVGKIGLSSGPLMAAPDNFDLTISGRGGHAAMPQEVIEPIPVSAQVINALQTLYPE